MPGTATILDTSPPSQRVVTRFGDFCVATVPHPSGGYVAWAKMGNIVGPSPLYEPGQHVPFAFGRTRDEAREKVLEELGMHGFMR